MTCPPLTTPRVHASRDTASHLSSHISKCSRGNTSLFCTTSKMERDVDFLLALFTGNVVVTDEVVDAFLSIGKVA